MEEEEEEQPPAALTSEQAAERGAAFAFGAASAPVASFGDAAQPVPGTCGLFPFGSSAEQ